MGEYHNKLNIRSFKNSVYIKKFEDTFDIKISQNNLQYELIFETYNTFVEINNILFSKKYMLTSKKVDKIINSIETYTKKYRNKITKCLDTNCNEILETLNIYYSELKELQELERIKSGTKLNIKHISSRVETLMTMLDMIEFDRLYNCKGMTYERQVNEKIPKKYNCKIFTDEEIMDGLLFYNNLKSLNDTFFAKYYDKTGIDLNCEIDQKDFIINLHKNIVSLNNYLVDYYTYKDTLVLELILPKLKKYAKQDISFVKDISYTTLFNKFANICVDISEKDFDNAFKKIKLIIDNDDMNIYERIS